MQNLGGKQRQLENSQFFFSLYVGLIINWNSHIKAKFQRNIVVKGLHTFFHTFARQSLRPRLRHPAPTRVRNSITSFETSPPSRKGCATGEKLSRADSLTWLMPWFNVFGIKVRVFWAKLKLQKHGKIPISVWAVFFLYFSTETVLYVVLLCFGSECQRARGGQIRLPFEC